VGLMSSKGTAFFDLLTSQANQLVIGVDLLNAIFSTPEDERKELRKQLHKAENVADDLNHDLINKLNQSFITPFDREDLSDLASALDDCMDLFDEAGDLLVLYRLAEIPEPVNGLIARQVDVLTKCARLTADSMPLLKKPSLLRDYWVEINSLENDGDKAYRKTLKHLFDSGLDPVTIIKLKDIVEVLEKCTDAFEDLANTVEGIAVKES